MKCKFVLLAFAVFILLALPVQSLEIVGFEDVTEKTFYSGDFVDLGTVLINNETKGLNLTVEQYIVRPGIPPMPLYEEFVIGAGNDTMVSDMSFEVSEYSASGEYTHVVSVYDAGSGDLKSERVSTFYVSGTNESFSEIDIAICADSSCDDVRPVFLLGETAYIKVECPENPEITGYVNAISGGTTTLDFDGRSASFKANSEGVYMAKIILSKDGFFTETIEKNITFVGEAAKPTYYFCNETEDGVCEDCPVGEDPDCMKIAEMNNFYLPIAIIAAVIVIAGLLAFWILKGKKGKIGA